MSKSSTIKTRQSFQWIQASDSGKTYLCPAGSFRNTSDLSDEQLRRLCVDESENPHND